MQIHLLFKKALLAAAVAGVLSMSIALILSLIHISEPTRPY